MRLLGAWNAVTTRMREWRRVVMTTRKRPRSVRPILGVRSSPSTVSASKSRGVVIDDLFGLFRGDSMAGVAARFLPGAFREFPPGPIARRPGSIDQIGRASCRERE